jgi:hypothetical protein
MEFLKSINTCFYLILKKMKIKYIIITSFVILLYSSEMSFSQDTSKYTFEYLKSSFDLIIQKENSEWSGMLNQIRYYYSDKAVKSMSNEAIEDSVCRILSINKDSVTHFKDIFFTMGRWYNRVLSSLRPDCSYSKKRVAVFVSILTDYILPSRYKYIPGLYYDYSSLYNRIKKDFNL